MLRKDLIERQVEELGRVLAKMLADALGLNSDGGRNSETISRVLQQQLDLDIDLLIHLPDEEFLQTLKNTGKFDSGNLEKLGDLLLLMAESGAQNKLELYRKCLALYQYIDKTDKIFDTNRQSKIQKIMRLI